MVGRRLIMRALLPSGWLKSDLLPALAASVALIMVCAVHAFFIWPSPVQVGFDEGYEAAVVERIIDGRFLPYVDGLSHRGPFLYWTQAIFHFIFGRFEWTGTRFLSLGAALTTVSSAFLAGWAARWPVAGAFAALTNVFVTCAVVEAGAGVGIHGEPVAVAYLALGFFLVCYALYRAESARLRASLLVAGGALTAICGLTKQTLSLAALPLAFAVLLHSAAQVPLAAPGESRWRRLARHGGVHFIAGGVGLVLLVLALYAAAGELDTFFYWSMGFNAKVYLAPYQGRILRELGKWFWSSDWGMAGMVMAALVLARSLSFVENRSPRAVLAAIRAAWFEISVASVAIALLLAATLPMRFWPHYFFPIYPFFGLVAGVIVEALVRRGPGVPRAAQAGVLLIACIMAVTHPIQRLIHLHKQREAGYWVPHRPEPACAEIDRIAGVGRTPIFIWGTVGDLYITCQRPSASMFTYTTVQAGIIPPFWKPDPSRVTPGSRETLLKELSTSPPPVIIDVPISKGAGMTDIPMYADLLRSEYCRASTIKDRRGRDLAFYARRDLDACKPVTPRRRNASKKRR